MASLGAQRPISFARIGFNQDRKTAAREPLSVQRRFLKPESTLAGGIDVTLAGALHMRSELLAG